MLDSIVTLGSAAHIEVAGGVLRERHRLGELGFQRGDPALEIGDLGGLGDSARLAGRS